MSTDALRRLDERIAAGLGAAGLVDTATIHGQAVQGYFTNDFVTDGAGEDAIGGYELAFDCRAEDVPEDLFKDDTIAVAGYGEYRFLHKERHGNDRSLLVLGSLL